MWVYVCVYTHTHSAQMGYSVVSPGVGMRHLEGPNNPDELNLGIYTRAHRASSKAFRRFLTK